MDKRRLYIRNNLAAAYNQEDLQVLLSEWYGTIHHDEFREEDLDDIVELIRKNILYSANTYDLPREYIKEIKQDPSTLEDRYGK